MYPERVTCIRRNVSVDIIYTGWRKKTGPSYLIANILKTPRPNCVEIGELLQYYMLKTVINFLFKNFIALWRHLAKTPLLSFIHTVQIDLCIFTLQKFTNFHAIRSWSFHNICNEIGWPRFFAPPCMDYSRVQQLAAVYDALEYIEYILLTKIKLYRRN